MVTNSSNENVLGFDASNNVFSISGGGNLADITQYGEIKTQSSPKDNCTWKEILTELKKMNFYLAEMSDIELDTGDA